MSSARRAGRRPGSPDTRAAILDAARQLFGTRGFAGTSVRAIAQSAGVDPALVHHYFGTKDALFLAALRFPVDPRVLLAPAIAEGPKGAGERMLRVFLSVWDDPALQLPLLGLVRSIAEPDGQVLLREGFLKVVIGPVGVALGIDEPERRMPLVASQVLGLIMVRYLLKVEPLASMSPDEVVAIYAPTLQRYLTGELP
ncbi:MULTISPECIES: TetR family transcriptional regulator [unclassified Nocardioides]|uniref:TetR/AcrR family transcriptional regulator n=1 Tax=unclassified Nocardioides TaxID=2615069 RepID=UPI0006F9C9DE|nr:MULTISPECIES: TetR family transcriptional regulator [unclassified Nocardioides]KQY50192.1 TetR family transcriptional regulator [Nocardioides sp. Root140]KQZ75817.1 TetR family transcriptional regulator [Nocardioides sp. Root151]KRF14888.1 TetR family transcriptional regulator [Nocardioides sp. Soil796]